MFPVATTTPAGQTTKASTWAAQGQRTEAHCSYSSAREFMWELWGTLSELSWLWISKRFSSVSWWYLEAAWTSWESVEGQHCIWTFGRGLLSKVGFTNDNSLPCAKEASLDHACNFFSLIQRWPLFYEQLVSHGSKHRVLKIESLFPIVIRLSYKLILENKVKYNNYQHKWKIHTQVHFANLSVGSVGLGPSFMYSLRVPSLAPGSPWSKGPGNGSGMSVKSHLHEKHTSQMFFSMDLFHSFVPSWSLSK